MSFYDQQKEDEGDEGQVLTALIGAFICHDQAFSVPL